jgi:hypothetical protein
VIALVFGIIFYDDPFFVLAIDKHNTIVTNEVFTGFFLLSTAAFMCMLLLFWLELFEAVGSNSHAALGLGDYSLPGNSPGLSRGGGGATTRITAKGNAAKTTAERGFCWCRLVLFVIFGLCLTILLFSQRLHQDGDPSYSSKADMPHFKALFGMVVFCIVVYLVNLARVVYMCFVDMRARESSAAAFFLFWLTLSVVLTMAVGVFAHAVGPVRSAGPAFLGFHTIYNV